MKIDLLHPPKEKQECGDHQAGSIKQMQGADKKHAALQGLKSFLHAIMDVNDISSQGNNQIAFVIIIHFLYHYLYIPDFLCQSTHYERRQLWPLIPLEISPRLYN